MLWPRTLFTSSEQPTPVGSAPIPTIIPAYIVVLYYLHERHGQCINLKNHRIIYRDIPTHFLNIPSMFIQAELFI